MPKFVVICREAGTERVLKRLNVEAFDRDAAADRAKEQMKRLGYEQRIRYGVRCVGRNE